MFTNKQIATFSDLEHSLYNYIFKNIEKVIHMRIRDLATATHVSTTTILRFCKKLDCDGFSEFKIKLKMYMEEQSDPNSLIRGEKGLTEFLERTLSEDFQHKITVIAKAIAKAKRVIFIGIGSSGILAEYGSRYFSGLRKFALYIKDPFLPIHEQYLEDSVTIVLSVSGNTSAILSQVNQFKQEGSEIISITNNADSPLAKIADYNLSYYVSTEFLGNTNLTTQIPVVYLLEHLAKATYHEMEL
ncbi:DNA-binding MurR/RpiR family transcriptional regulator [Natronobacillus azotifigens]|uniref:MurR/RpiR family transcriptional regulator n=1 Tax=Natronobacillus azotifigens TaxID=472978 RepID=A0A9J6RAC5_9BACI|nr:MurR/RpiR family transcriptional regulator [Natronobacillus azotifigens]MCZ0702487.1 MurR/RpiR family transcriptional regulator [Natronobacillus azotifigens]